MDVYDPTPLDEYGYSSYPNVITSLEFERLISAGGPTEGYFVRPSDQTRPKRIGFVQCVGSRTAHTDGNSNGDRGNTTAPHASISPLDLVQIPPSPRRRHICSRRFPGS